MNILRSLSAFVAAALALSACSHSTTPPTPGSSSLKAGSVFSYDLDATDPVSGLKTHQTESDTVIATGVTWGGQSDLVQYGSSMRDFLPYIRKGYTGGASTAANSLTQYSWGPTQLGMNASGDLLFPALVSDTVYVDSLGQLVSIDSGIEWRELPIGSHKLSIFKEAFGQGYLNDTIQYVSSGTIGIGGNQIATEHVRLSQVITASPSMPPRVMLFDYYFAPSLGVIAKTEMSIAAPNGIFVPGLTKMLTSWK